jgi:dolichol-phosphate mannosyltransferase
LIAFGALIVSGLSVLAAIAQIIGRILHPELPHGVALIIVISLFLGSANLLSLAFIAEYIAKIFEEVKQRPQFVVTKLLNFDQANAPPEVLPPAAR